MAPPANRKKKSENLLLNLVSKYFPGRQSEHREVPDVTVRPVSGPGLCQGPHRAGFAAALPSCRPKGTSGDGGPERGAFPTAFSEEKPGRQVGAFKEKAEAGSLR